MTLSHIKAIVTGGASGLGAATARHLAGQGAQVCIFDHNPAGPGAPDLPSWPLDVTDAAAAEHAVQAATAQMTGLTALINCAGIVIGAKTLGRDGPHDLDRFRQVIDVNLTGSFNLARLAAAAMADNVPDDDGGRGAIIHTASIAAFEGQAGQAAYAASKAGVAGLTLPMARDLARSGIRVNAIAPGLILTPMLEGLGPEIIAGLAQDVVFPKRLGAPDEFARLAAFILTAPYLNGTVIRLDGGLRMQ